MLFLANPNNPTGTYLGGEELERLQAGLRPDILFVLDSAYAEYVTAEDYDVGINLVNANENVVMVRTFSKMGLAASRIGWMYAPGHVVDVVNRIRGPFNVNRPAQFAGAAAARVGLVAAQATGGDAIYLRRIPVRLKDDIVLVPCAQLASVVADGELLHLTTAEGKRYIINYRLKDLGARLDPAMFVRISRSAVVNLDMMAKVSAMPGGTYLVTLTNRQQLAVSRQRARDLREELLKL